MLRGLTTFFSIVWDYVRHSTKSIMLVNPLVNQGRVYTLEYEYSERQYKICFPKDRKPRDIKYAFSEGDDVTKDIYSYLGPAHNFHGIRTTPNMLGYSNIEIKYRNGEIVKYDGDEVIHPRYTGLLS